MNSVIALESPLEALALNYLAHAVNSIWAWIAVVTAAVSFWSIRAFSSPPPPEIRSRIQLAAAETSSSPPPPAKAAEEPTAAVTSTAPVDRIEAQVLLSAPKSKTKFSLYYEEAEEEEEDGRDCDGEDAVAAVGERLEKWCDDWERMMEVRMGDMGWYRWQDTAALDGSVVRLWDGGCGAAVVVGNGGVAW